MTKPVGALLLLPVAAAGFILCVQLTRETVNVGVDGVTYLATASNIDDGRGVTTPFTFANYPPSDAVRFDGEVPLTHFPPLYPIAIAVVGALGLAPIDAARWLGCTTLALDLVLFGLLAKRATAARGWLLPAVATVLLLVGPAATQGFGLGLETVTSWLVLSGSVFSESMFLAFCLLGLLALARWLDEPSASRLGLVAAAAAAATLTRYAGVALIACAGIAALAWGTGGARRRARDAALLVGGAALPSILWALVTRMQGGESTRAVVLHVPGENLSRLLSTGSRWFFRSSIADPTRQVLFAVLLVVFAAMAADLVRLHARDPGTTARRVLALFAVCYLATVEITRFFLDASTPIDGRLLAPLQPVLYALMLGILVAWLRARVRMPSGRAGLAAAVVAALLALTGVASTLSDARKGFALPLRLMLR
jgi:hypothetical protein